MTREDRGPTWAPRMVDELVVHSMLRTQLCTKEVTLGALNIYSPKGTLLSSRPKLMNATSARR
jgi:hypothetical protein